MGTGGPSALESLTNEHRFRMSIENRTKHEQSETQVNRLEHQVQALGLLVSVN